MTEDKNSYKKVELLGIVSTEYPDNFMVDIYSKGEVIPRAKQQPGALFKDDGDMVVIVHIERYWASVVKGKVDKELDTPIPFLTLIDELPIEIDKVYIQKNEKKYTGKIHLTYTEPDKEIVVYSGPGEAIAISVFTKTPIFMKEKRIEEIGYEASEYFKNN